MEFETLLKEVANADHVPDEALAALVPYAGELAPHVEALARRRMVGDWLFPTEDNLLFFGLFVLAAARAQSFWPTWLEMLTDSNDGLEGLFGDGAIMSIRTITLGLIGDDPGPVAELAARIEISADARTGLMEALTRIMCAGNFPRDKFIALIDRLVTLEGSDDDDRCKWCAADAIVFGGIGERAEQLEALWQTSAFSTWREIDRAHEREIFAAARTHPTDMNRFDEDGISAPNTPADALRWLTIMQQHDRKSERVTALTWREREWLAAFLQKIDTGEDAMRFEELDGFFHALVIGPDLVMPSEYLHAIWGEGPVFDNDEQVREVLGLIQRHWNAISGRVADEASPVMWLETQEDAPPGAYWVRGFARGVQLRARSWQAVALDEDAAMALDCILAIDSEELEFWVRGEHLDMLDVHFSTLAKFWREQRRPRPQVRTQKVGRNDPCPCGSGKKWKKCCGAGPPPMVH